MIYFVFLFACLCKLLFFTCHVFAIVLDCSGNFSLLFSLLCEPGKNWKSSFQKRITQSKQAAGDKASCWFTLKCANYKSVTFRPKVALAGGGGGVVCGWEGGKGGGGEVGNLFHALIWQKKSAKKNTQCFSFSSSFFHFLSCSGSPVVARSIIYVSERKSQFVVVPCQFSVFSSSFVFVNVSIFWFHSKTKGGGGETPKQGGRHQHLLLLLQTRRWVSTSYPNQGGRRRRRRQHPSTQSKPKHNTKPNYRIPPRRITPRTTQHTVLEMLFVLCFMIVFVSVKCGCVCSMLQ